MSFGSSNRRDVQLGRRQSRSPGTSPAQYGSSGGGLSGLKLRLLIGAAIVLFSIMSFYGNNQTNPITGRAERVAMSVNDEIQLGLSHRGQMGQLSRDARAGQHVAEVGNQLVNALQKQLAKTGRSNPYRFEFHLLGDRRMVNAFALPGGQIFITEGLYRQLTSDDQLAGVLAHEMGHVIERHGAKQMAKQGLVQGVTGAASVLGGDANTGRTAAAIGNMMTMRYSREAEFEADNWAVELALMATYNPAEMITVMELLKQISGGQAPPEFLSTHPNTDSRIENIKQQIRNLAIQQDQRTGRPRVEIDDRFEDLMRTLEQ